MSDRSRIEWTDATWNPVTGCTPVSAGCVNCYARRMAQRFRGPRGFEVTLHMNKLNLPHHWKKPRRVFVASMGDLFHPDVPESFIRDVFRVMNCCPQHTFQVLTKRPERMVALGLSVMWTANIWAGVTVEHVTTARRADVLRKVPAAVRFLSCEPLIGAIDSALDLRGIHWVIVGGETGPHARPMWPRWVRDIHDRCVKHEPPIPFFFKRWGGSGPNRNNRELDGRMWEQTPYDH
jgi:protein gp37